MIYLEKFPSETLVAKKGWDGKLHTRQLGNAGEDAGHEALVVLVGLCRLVLLLGCHFMVVWTGYIGVMCLCRWAQMRDEDKGIGWI